MKFKDFYSNSLDESSKGQYDSLSFEDAKIKQKELEDELNKLADELKKLGSGTGSMGMTPEHVKSMPEWKNVKQKQNVAFAKLRDFNSFFTKKFKKQIRDEHNRRGYGKV